MEVVPDFRPECCHTLGSALLLVFMLIRGFLAVALCCQAGASAVLPAHRGRGYAATPGYALTDGLDALGSLKRSPTMTNPGGDQVMSTLGALALRFSDRVSAGWSMCERNILQRHRCKLAQTLGILDLILENSLEQPHQASGCSSLTLAGRGCAEFWAK